MPRRSARPGRSEPAVAPPRRASAPERLLTTADALFYAEGIHAVGIDRILAASGVAKASLYQHFGSKDALVGAYLRRRIDDWHGYLDGALPAMDGDPEAKLLAVFELIAAWMREPGFRGCPFINAAAELPAADHPGHLAVLDHRSRTRARFRSLAVDLQVDEPDALAASLVLLYDGALVAADLGRADDAADALLTSVRQILAGYGRGGRAPKRSRAGAHDA